MPRVSTPLRPLNKYGVPDDVATDHGWVHSNIQIFGDQIPDIAKAFKTDNPFDALGYTEEDTTRSIAKWYARPSKLDNSYLVSWESYLQPPREFCKYLAETYSLNLKMEYTQAVKPEMLKEYFNWHKPIPTYHLI
jgi:hypothetical protein